MPNKIDLNKILEEHADDLKNGASISIHLDGETPIVEIRHKSPKAESSNKQENDLSGHLHAMFDQFSKNIADMQNDINKIFGNKN